MSSEAKSEYDKQAEVCQEIIKDIMEKDESES